MSLSQTTHNFYLILDAVMDGDLFKRIIAKGNYSETDAAETIRTVLGGVRHIHSCGIAHRHLKPENLCFRFPGGITDIVITDFGFSQIVDVENFKGLTDLGGTLGYMAPEMLQLSGHSKPVDLWAVGVITYFLLCGYTPFDKKTLKEEAIAICEGRYSFQPKEFWQNVSKDGRNFVRALLTAKPTRRPTATRALQHPWLASPGSLFDSNPSRLMIGSTYRLSSTRGAAKNTFRQYDPVDAVVTKRFSSPGPIQTREHRHASESAESESEPPGMSSGKTWPVRGRRQRTGSEMPTERGFGVL